MTETKKRIGLGVGDWIALAALMASLAVPTIGLLWRISTDVTVVANNVNALIGDVGKIEGRVTTLEPRVDRLETIVEERTRR